MKTVLAIGNAMNGGTWKGSAIGFRLNSLTKLQQTKSSDGKFTVLDYLIEMLQDRCDNGDLNSSLALNLCNDCEELSQCKQISLSEIEKDIRVLDDDYKVFQQVLQSSDFTDNLKLHDLLDRLGKTLQTIHGELLTTKQTTEELIGFFGESGNTITSVLTTLDEFLMQLKVAREKLTQRKLKEKKALAAASSASASTSSKLKPAVSTSSSSS